jgi:hypothetical protein
VTVDELTGELLSIDEVPPLGVVLPPQPEIPIMINTMKPTKATPSLFAFIDGPSDGFHCRHDSAPRGAEDHW